MANRYQVSIYYIGKSTMYLKLKYKILKSFSHNPYSCVFLKEIFHSEYLFYALGKPNALLGVRYLG